MKCPCPLHIPSNELCTFLKLSHDEQRRLKGLLQEYLTFYDKCLTDPTFFREFGATETNVLANKFQDAIGE